MYMLTYMRGICFLYAKYMVGIWWLYIDSTLRGRLTPLPYRGSVLKEHRGGGARWMVVVVCTPAGNRTLIKGLGNLYSIH